MSNGHSGIIVVLLCVIVAILLFGHEAVLNYSAQAFLWMLGGCLLLAIIWVFWLFAEHLFIGLPKEFMSDPEDLGRAKKPRIAEAILLIVCFPFSVLFIVGLIVDEFWFNAAHPYVEFFVAACGLVAIVSYAVFLVIMTFRWVRR